ncbi:MAG: hypothetical protein CMN84_07020 [Spongiibacteraceae bacterium]|jgi:hypothetical protein|nr:hypothetical protein [Spongiibacteraceae bacterium]
MRAKQDIELLQEAVKAFEAETNLTIDIVGEGFFDNHREIDGMIELPYQAGRLGVEVKNWAQHANIGAIANQIKAMPVEGMLVADYINPAMAERLRKLGIHFLDTVGNAYINKPPLYIWVINKKPNQAHKQLKEGGNRAFDATGLKVVFGVLCNPGLVAAPYRKIAEQTDVALGTVGWVVNGLKEAGYLLDRGKKKDRRLTERQKLLERWVEAYPEKLQPKLKLGEFVADNPHWWEAVDTEKYDAFWGGEIAAAKYTGYLKPKMATVYLPEARRGQFLADARLRKAPDHVGAGNRVKVYGTFWRPDRVNANREIKDTKAIEKYLTGVAPPILVYADLIATGDGRNREAARMIHERYIAEHLRED